MASTDRACTGVVSGLALRRIRLGIGITQQDLADHLGVDPNTVKGWETARRPLGHAKDADKLDMLLRAREYQAEGYRLVDEWVRSAARDMRTATGRALAERACEVSPSTWWRDVVSAYQLPRET